MTEKKPNPLDLPKAYDPKITDAKWYHFWEEKHFFQADAESPKPPYCIVIPPPNVTGKLHMGHALVNTLQDVLIRWKRMSGYEALWVPGTDHAGIATQTVVERHLMATEGKRRKDYSREEFLAIVWNWKEENEKRILEQLKALGCTCDWTRLRFTMDEGCNRAVRVIFKKLFDAGLIYRGDYLVNWDPVTQTALADDEVEYEEREGFLWFFKYPLADGSGSISVATTRPETLLGDVAIAVSPRDERYRRMIEKKARHPLAQREIPIIADHTVDPEFGTGAVKITPAHDPNDYKIGREHGLPMINIFTPDARINENGMEFAGMAREEAREAVVRKMKALGYLEKVVPHLLRVGVSYRSKAVLEPYLSKQWFVKMSPFVGPLTSAVTEGSVKITPSTWESTFFHWVNNLRDWCISRQLWWGHRIPVWYRKDDPEKMLCFDGSGLPPEVAREPDKWVQDEDVLDTWFSSSLWPISTLGWPEKTPDFKKFYPTSVLVTGHDILFFWVARMMFMCEFATGQFPFPETFLHGLIYGKSYWKKNPDGGITYITGDEKKQYDLGKPIPPGVFSKWEKLSKSKGNIIDPLELIEEYGTDAVRMSLCAGVTHAPEIDLDRRRFEEYKNFANKIWNGARFVFMNLEGLTCPELSAGLDENLLSLEDRWILSALNRTNKEVNQALISYAFDQAALLAYDFYWKEFCAYYVEIAKPMLFGKTGSVQERKQKQKLLVILLCNALRLLHPMAPFITEELFQLLKGHFFNLKQDHKADPYTKDLVEAIQAPACIVASYPKLLREQDVHPEIEATFALMEKIIYTIRSIRGEMKIPPQTATDVYIVGDAQEIEFQIAEKNRNIISALVKTQKITTSQTAPQVHFSATGAVGHLKIIIPLPAELEAKEKERLEKEKARILKLLERLRIQLENPEFLEKANPELIEKQRQSLTQAEQELQTIESKLKG